MDTVAVRCRGQITLVKNASAKEANQQEEEIFSKEPWNRIPKNQQGIGALKTKLEKLLVRHIRNTTAEIKN